MASKRVSDYILLGIGLAVGTIRFGLVAVVAVSSSTISRKPLLALTGATGFIGQFLLNELPNRGYRLRVLLRRPANLPAQSSSAVIGDLAGIARCRSFGAKAPELDSPGKLTGRSRRTVQGIYELGGHLPADMVEFHNISACPPAKLPANPRDINAILEVLLGAEQCAVKGYTHIAT